MGESKLVLAVVDEIQAVAHQVEAVFGFGFHMLPMRRSDTLRRDEMKR